MLTRSLVLLVCQFRHFRISCYQAVSLCNHRHTRLDYITTDASKNQHLFIFFLLLIIVYITPGANIRFGLHKVLFHFFYRSIYSLIHQYIYRMFLCYINNGTRKHFHFSFTLCNTILTHRWDSVWIKSF